MSAPIWWRGAECFTVGSGFRVPAKNGSPRTSSLAAVEQACGFASETDSGSVRSFGLDGSRLFAQPSASATRSTEQSPWAKKKATPRGRPCGNNDPVSVFGSSSSLRGLSRRPLNPHIGHEIDVLEDLNGT